MSQQVGVVRADWLTALRGVPSVYVIPELKLVYLSTAKNACTAIKWTIAELAGEEMRRFQYPMRLGPYLFEDQAVHTRRRFENAVMAQHVAPEVAREIRPDNGWFIFGVVRDPRARLFSAWQDKFLLHEPQFDWAIDEPWFPRYPVVDADAIISDFARFVDVFASDQELRAVRSDPHFRSQAEALHADLVPYSKLYPLETIGQLRTDLETHVRAQGYSQPVTFRRSNSTPLRANAAVFANGVRERIEDLYRVDFDLFGDLFDFGVVADAPQWTKADIAQTQVRAALGRRVSEVRRIALDHRERSKEHAARAARAEARIEKLTGELEKLTGELESARRRTRALEDQFARLPSTRVRRRARQAARRMFGLSAVRSVLRTRGLRRLKTSKVVRRLRNATY